MKERFISGKWIAMAVAIAIAIAGCAGTNAAKKGLEGPENAGQRKPVKEYQTKMGNTKLWYSVVIVSQGKQKKLDLANQDYSLPKVVENIFFAFKIESDGRDIAIRRILNGKKSEWVSLPLKQGEIIHFTVECPLQPEKEYRMSVKIALIDEADIEHTETAETNTISYQIK